MSRNATASTTATNDPWQITPPVSTTAQANPWSNNNSTAANNNTGLSLNLEDPWGLGGSESQAKTTTTTTAATTSKTVDNELSEFFGANAGKLIRMFYLKLHVYIFMN